ncbi:hypothetical protein GUITHDRAFT_116352 [Guillardia theta CCMP2712]|uniref:Uncharacterized protein n=1 Tax=Guillardia theta (strain CCMP2712) TaxID=905079 RepID=L1INT0_GUITC|nr:hypothetical protein GUITHDRAFT_116352 [Guillardia theta CCMP2712]EKX37544.1 hypothetical protein GUITHDRAFT_116352 [Guillardia theta CCMP2712]|eukprot:XP_005824524.1 hypothetical protein GUITHDRAFT_116352 [Guillardia theta CCMP2712]
MGNSSSTLPSRKAVGVESSIWTLTCNELCHPKSDGRDMRYSTPISTAPVRPVHYPSHAIQQDKRKGDVGGGRSSRTSASASMQDGDTLYLTDRDHKFEIPVTLQDAKKMLGGRTETAYLEQMVGSSDKSASSSRRLAEPARAAGGGDGREEERSNVQRRNRLAYQTLATYGKGGGGGGGGGGSTATPSASRSRMDSEDKHTEQQKELLERLQKNLSRFPPRHHSVPNIVVPLASDGREVNVSPSMLSAQRVV